MASLGSGLEPYVRRFWGLLRLGESKSGIRGAQTQTATYRRLLRGTGPCTRCLDSKLWQKMSREDLHKLKERSSLNRRATLALCVPQRLPVASPDRSLEALVVCVVFHIW